MHIGFLIKMSSNQGKLLWEKKKEGAVEANVILLHYDSNVDHEKERGWAGLQECEDENLTF